MFNNNNNYDPYGMNYAPANWSNPVNNVPNMFNGNSQNTNVLRVTSLEEAIMKTNARGSEMVYFHQTKDEFYVVRVDINGNKSWQTFPYSVPNANVNAPVNRAEFDALAAKLAELEAKLNGGVVNESNGQSAV